MFHFLHPLVFYFFLFVSPQINSQQLSCPQFLGAVSRFSPDQIRESTREFAKTARAGLNLSFEKRDRKSLEPLRGKDVALYGWYGYSNAAGPGTQIVVGKVKQVNFYDEDLDLVKSLLVETGPETVEFLLSDILEGRLMHAAAKKVKQVRTFYKRGDGIRESQRDFDLVSGGGVSLSPQGLKPLGDIAGKAVALRGWNGYSKAAGPGFLVLTGTVVGASTSRDGRLAFLTFQMDGKPLKISSEDILDLKLFP